MTISVLNLHLDKLQFLSNYGNVIEECKTREIIWKDSICNGRNDCSDGSDEFNCTKCKFLCNAKIRPNALPLLVPLQSKKVIYNMQT